MEPICNSPYHVAAIAKKREINATENQQYQGNLNHLACSTKKRASVLLDQVTMRKPEWNNKQWKEDKGDNEMDGK